MEVLLVEPGKEARTAEIGSGLRAMQDTVGGYIEAMYPYADEVAIVCNEEGKMLGLPLNRAVRNDDGHMLDVIAGTFFVCGLGEENFCSLPKDLQAKYLDKFRWPEKFLSIGGQISVVQDRPHEAKHSPPSQER